MSLNLPRLPLAGAGDGKEITFNPDSTGWRARVFEDGMLIDEFRRHTFREVYDAVRDEYPQAAWDGLDGEEEACDS